MSKRKTAAWFRRNRLFIVRPPDWPKHCELSFVDRDMMIELARGCGLMLKEVCKA